MQDAAGIDRLFGSTSLAQGIQLQLELSQLLNALFHMGNMLIEDRIDGAAALGRLDGQIEQRVNFPMAHVQCAAVSNEAQTLKMFGAVNPEITRRACRFRQQAFLFVVTHRFNRALGYLCQLTNLHKNSKNPLTL